MTRQRGAQRICTRGRTAANRPAEAQAAAAPRCVSSRRKRRCTHAAARAASVRRQASLRHRAALRGVSMAGLPSTPGPSTQQRQRKLEGCAEGSLAGSKSVQRATQLSASLFGAAPSSAAAETGLRAAVVVSLPLSLVPEATTFASLPLRRASLLCRRWTRARAALAPAVLARDRGGLRPLAALRPVACRRGRHGSAWRDAPNSAWPCSACRHPPAGAPRLQLYGPLNTLMPVALKLQAERGGALRELCARTQTWAQAHSAVAAGLEALPPADIDVQGAHLRQATRSASVATVAAAGEAVM